MKKKNLAIFGVIALIALATVGVVMANFIASPIDQPLNLPTEPAQAVEDEELVAATAQPAVCGELGAYTLLIIGADYSIGEPPHGADAVRVLRVDFANQKISMAAIDRDLWLPVPVSADAKDPSQKLGLAYEDKRLSANGTDKEKVIAATEQVAQMLMDAFAIRPDHYITIQLDWAAVMIDTIGGVDVILPQKLKVDDKLTYPAGLNHLEGEKAVMFVRTNDDGEPNRMDRQNLFLQAMMKKFKEGGWITKLPQLFEQFGSAITTDLSPAQINNLACLTEKVSFDQIATLNVDKGMLKTDAKGNLVPDGDTVKQLLQNMLK